MNELYSHKDKENALSSDETSRYHHQQNLAISTERKEAEVAETEKPQQSDPTP
jgi:hypothetical protein